ncbi:MULTISPECIES: hypothetical protein [unclassified Coleofasciculus]|uniref:hypothetical protein n=1 Tax=unclassified Coleofasciculus TaxID=2692782 RepID=UPI001880799A|nr:MULTISPECIES: hypothetical protein [unclassified Coleofasciculus]MBE9129644.1 hypothetical protein [Coleofasciculus sp. LEGE 07081]MBE9152166.1 hypothetical protein [Coleofasciculus sp. LEGE 07092]
MTLPKLPRQFVRLEDSPDYEREIWQPSWRCFCCRDKGEVAPHLASLVVERYELGKDKIPRCQNPGCNAGENLDSLGKSMVDYRFTAAICQQLDVIHREDWRQTTQLKAACIAQKTAALAQQKSLRKCVSEAGRISVHRTPTEEMEAQQKHAAVLAGWGLEAHNDDERDDADQISK